MKNISIIMNRRVSFARKVRSVMPTVLATLVVVAITGIVLLPGISNAQIAFQNPLKYNSVEELLTGLVSWAVKIGTLVAVFFFIYAGFKYVIAMGDETKLKDARKTLTNAAIGTAILVGANVIVTLVQNTLTSIRTP